MYLLSILASFAIVLGWFAALVLGRLPEPIARYLCRFIPYMARVYAYGMLLTDRYPPFTYPAPGYPVDVDLSAGRLNRLAVLFRGVLVVPALVVMWLSLFGSLLASPVVWLIALVRGGLPAPVAEALAAVLRYIVRHNAYAFLVTPAYPSGLFSAVPPPPSIVAADVEEPAPVPLDVEAEDVAARGDRPLTQPARRLVVLFLVLGLLGYGASFALGAFEGAKSARANAAVNDLVEANERLGEEFEAFQQQTAACQSDADQLTCLKLANDQLATSVELFRAEVQRIDVASSATDARANLEVAADGFARALRDLAAADSPDAYDRAIPALTPSGAQFDSAYRALVEALLDAT